MTTMTPEQLEQFLGVLGPMVTAAIQPLMIRLQQSEAANTQLNTQLAQLAARQAFLPEEREEQRHGHSSGAASLY